MAHIVGLVNKRFYNGLRVHRLVPNFVVQFGDPQTRDMTKKEQWGTGGSGTPIGVAEISKMLQAHASAWCRWRTAAMPRRPTARCSSSSARRAHLDGKFPIFGKVTTGMDVVRKLAVDDRIIRATVKGAT